MTRYVKLQVVRECTTGPKEVGCRNATACAACMKRAFMELPKREGGILKTWLCYWGYADAHHVFEDEEDFVMLPDDFLELHDGRVLQLPQRQHLPQPQRLIPAEEISLHFLHCYLHGAAVLNHCTDLVAWQFRASYRVD